MSNAHSHLVLGYGNIGKAVAVELAARGHKYTIAGRHDPGTGEHFLFADASDAASLLAITKGVSHLYITLGVPYDLKIWRKQWPLIIENVISASKANGFKIAFFDNIYMYGPAPLENPITEDHPQNPPSKKGAVRKQIADRLLSAHQRGEVSVVIGRSADFYGPNVTNSIMYASALENLLVGKKAQFIGNPHSKHSYTYVPDAGRALVQLATDASAYGQAWHLPTGPASYSNAEFLDLFADKLNAPKGIQILPKFLLKILALFIPILGEVAEMGYQTTTDYVFSSAKFEKKYPQFAVTAYDQGIKATLASFAK